ncbi:T9SS type A sorting domain-containing protein [uncultured Dokdonia sp.]|uniref:T9SS type A sorting domain-containing protein n=1 Tax=uncultured Dokdonia sp. TaxID=575653 RepID=UPI002626A1D9|nr:T9SS type A sorting domain-containing protein [uncultured Dokdonia sp.]
MNKILLILLFLFINYTCIHSQSIILSHSVDNDTGTVLATACFQDLDGDNENDTILENSWWRSYTPSAPEFGISGQFMITGVQFVSISSSTSEVNSTATIRLHISDGPFPNGSLTEIASESIVLDPSNVFDLINVNLATTTPIIVSADQEIVIQFEIASQDLVDFAENGIGANSFGQTAPSYLTTAAEPCGITDLADLGFPDVHYVLNLVGEEVLSIDENTIEGTISIYPNPVQDILTITAQRGIQNISLINLEGQVVLRKEINNEKNSQIDFSEISRGVHIIEIVSNGQKGIYKIIKE